MGNCGSNPTSRSWNPTHILITGRGPPCTYMKTIQESTIHVGNIPFVPWMVWEWFRYRVSSFTISSGGIGWNWGTCWKVGRRNSHVSSDDPEKNENGHDYGLLDAYQHVWPWLVLVVLSDGPDQRTKSVTGSLWWGPTVDGKNPAPLPMPQKVLIV